LQDKLKLNIFSTVPTPHNNFFFSKIIESNLFELRLYYNTDNVKMYSWKKNYYDEYREISKITGKYKINLQVLFKVLFNKKEKYFFIGWPNSTARLIILLLSILKREYYYWSDLPGKEKDYSFITKKVRAFYYYLVKNYARKVFVVGDFSIPYFIEMGFRKEVLVNLPIFIEVPEIDKEKAINIYNKYNISGDNLILCSGSRLSKQKGYDKLISALSKVEMDLLEKIKLFIVGKGEEKESLLKQTEELNLNDNIIFLDWMEPDEFSNLISQSYVYIHPAIYDAFGGGTLSAMAYGIPVIGSNGSGVVKERVRNKYNGLIYEADNTNELAVCIEYMLKNREEALKMGINAKLTAEEWQPEKGVQILFNNLN
jgi:glycosyltransferase involved in cell wall biosynthesis